MSNIYFHIEGEVFETLAEAQRYRKGNCPNGRIDEIYTNKDFEQFENDYINAREQNSILDSLEWAR
jgi:hypothetical protein